MQVQNTILPEVECLVPRPPFRSSTCAVVPPDVLSCPHALLEKLPVGSEGTGSVCCGSVMPTAAGDLGPSLPGFGQLFGYGNKKLGQHVGLRQ